MTVIEQNFFSKDSLLIYAKKARTMEKKHICVEIYPI